MTFHIENLSIKLYGKAETRNIDPIRVWELQMGVATLRPYGSKYPNNGVLGSKDHSLNRSRDLGTWTPRAREVDFNGLLRSLS